MREVIGENGQTIRQSSTSAFHPNCGHLPLECAISEADGQVGMRCYSSPIRSAAINASCGIDTLPYSRIFALPFFCFSSSFFLREISPP